MQFAKQTYIINLLRVLCVSVVNICFCDIIFSHPVRTTLRGANRLDIGWPAR